jgi:hypothetical protein
VNGQVQAGLIRAGLGVGLLYLFVTGALKNAVDKATAAVSGTPKGTPYDIRDLVSKTRPAVNTQGK